MTLFEKLKHLFASLFKAEEPIAEQALETTGIAVATAAVGGTVHGSEDMINVIKTSLQQQLPTLKPAAIMAASAVIADHHAEAAAAPAPTPTPTEDSAANTTASASEAPATTTTEGQ